MDNKGWRTNRYCKENTKHNERLVENNYILPTNPGEGVLNKVLYEEAPPRGPTPYPFIYHFWSKGTPFIYPLLKKVPLSHTYFRKSCSSFHVVLNK